MLRAENAVTVTHSNLKDHRVLELRVDQSETVQEVKERLYTYNGTAVSYMALTLMDGDRVVCARTKRQAQRSSTPARALPAPRRRWRTSQTTMRPWARTVSLMA